MEKYYGFIFRDKGSKMKLIKTMLPVDQVELSNLVSEIRDYMNDLTFIPSFAVIRELSYRDGMKVVMNAPSYVKRKKLQAIVFKHSKEQIITKKGGFYYRDEEKITLDFSLYEVTIITPEN